MEKKEKKEVNWTDADEMAMLGEMHLDRVQEDLEIESD